MTWGECPAFGPLLDAISSHFGQAIPKATPGGPVVLVDIIAHQPMYLLSTLLAANYMARLKGAALVAVTASVGEHNQMRLAKAFGVSEILTLEEAPLEGVEGFINQVLALMRPRRNGALREVILALRLGDIAIGDLIYDSILRAGDRPTITEPDEQLTKELLRAGKCFNLFQGLLDRYDVRLTMQGHVCYTPYGIMARLAAARGKPVYMRRWGNPMSIQRHDRPEDCRGWFRITKEQMRSLEEADPEGAREFVKQALAKRYRPMDRNDPTELVGAAYGADKKQYGKEDLLGSLGLDPGKPTVCILPQIFVDSPHDQGPMLHHDYYHWLSDTMEVAARTPSVNWLVKPHPHTPHYHETDPCLDVVRPFASANHHIAWAPVDLNTSSLFAMAHAVVTSTGSPGFEFPAFGIPAVITGRTIYSGLGFTREPRSLSAYHALLEDMANLPPATEEETAAAKRFFNAYLRVGRLTSTFLPEMNDHFWQVTTFQEVWTKMLDKLGPAPEEDPLYQALARESSALSFIPRTDIPLS